MNPMKQKNKKIECRFFSSFLNMNHYIRFDIYDKDSHKWFVFDVKNSDGLPPIPCFEFEGSEQNKETLKELLKELNHEQIQNNP